MVKFFLAVLLFLMLNAAYVSAAMITLGNPPSTLSMSYEESGFTLTGIDGTMLDGIGIGSSAPAIRVGRGTSGPLFSVIQTNGNPFDLISLDLKGADNQLIQAQVTITGIFADGVTPDLVVDYFPVDSGLTTFLTQDFLGLSSFIFFSNGQTQPSNLGVVDNIVINNVSTVPIPAAVWLFGSAVLGLFASTSSRTILNQN